MPAADLAVCAALLAALPGEIDPGVERREVEVEVGDEADPGADGRFAVWGDPVVVLECGVPLPDRLEPPAIVNGVAWTVRDIGPGFRWTTRDLTVNVSVDIPDVYANGAELINPLAAPLLQTVSVAPSPTPSPTP